jgi:hypothetical protein
MVLVLVLVRDSTNVYGELNNSRGTANFFFSVISPSAVKPKAA